MTYRSLPAHLHVTADAARKYFARHQGATSFVTEEPFHTSVAYCPTFSGKTRDHHLLAVEVIDCSTSASLERCVHDCMRNFVPVRFYLGYPIGITDTNARLFHRFASANSVGLLEIGTQATVVLQPLALSLAGVRPIEARRFPGKYKLALAMAEQTFRAGDPAKGCALLYDEIERICREIAKAALWQKAPGMNLDKDPWQGIAKFMLNHLDGAKAKALCPELDAGLIGRIVGVTAHRNDSGHKPANKAALVKRDKELRTRFESAADLLFDLVTASKPLRI